MLKKQRSYEWLDARQVAVEQSTNKGLEYLMAIRDGRLQPSPIVRTIGWNVVEVERGRAKLELPLQEYLLNPHVVHGGVLSLLLDSVTACAVISTLPEGKACTSLEIKVNYLRAVTLAVERVYCEGRILHSGRQSAVADGEVRDTAGKLYARATATFLVFDKNPTAT